MKEMFRDKSRDHLTKNLNSIGVNAQMAKRGRREEKIHDTWWQRSLGIIDIPDGHIRWINILKKDRSKHSGPLWHILFGIPDERPIQNGKSVQIRTIRKKTFPIFGKVVSVNWKGKDYGTGLAITLSHDEEISELSKRIGNLRIHSFDKGCTLMLGRYGKPSMLDRRAGPSDHDWAVLQKLAGYILSSSRLY
jgi:hypothetical protein